MCILSPQAAAVPTAAGAIPAQLLSAAVRQQEKRSVSRQSHPRSLLECHSLASRDEVLQNSVFLQSRCVYAI